MIIGEDLRNAEGNFNERIEQQANREKDFMKKRRKKKRKKHSLSISIEKMKPSDRISEKVFPNFRRLIEAFKAFDYFSSLIFLF